MDYGIIIIIVVVVLGFFIWAFVQSNGLSIFKKKKKTKTLSEAVSSQYTTPESNKPARPLKVRKRNLEEDFKKNGDLSKKSSRSEKQSASGGKVEQVFVKPPKQDEPVAANPIAEDSDFEKELDKLIYDLEREKKIGEKSYSQSYDSSENNSFGAPVPFVINPSSREADDFLADFDTDRYRENLELLRQREMNEKVYDKKSSNFNHIFEDEVKKYNSSLNIVRESPDVVTKDSKLEVKGPDFYKASFGERFKKVFDDESSKSNNIVVVGDREKRKKAKESRKKWL